MERAGNGQEPAGVEAVGVGSLIWLVLAVAALLLLLVFVSFLPGVDRLLPGLPITVGALVSAGATIVIVLLLLRIAATGRAVIQRFRIDPPDIPIRTAAIVFWSIVFIAVVIAYEGFAPAVEPVVIEAELLWTYDLAFLLLALLPLAMIAYQLFNVLDPLAEWCTEKLRAGTGGDPSTIQTTLPFDSPEATHGEHNES